MGPGEHSRCLLVADDLLLDRVPDDLSPRANGDVGDVADDVGVDGVVDVADRVLAASDRIDEVATLVAAFNQAVEQSQVMSAERMEDITGGLGGMLPGGLGGLFG